MRLVFFLLLSCFSLSVSAAYSPALPNRTSTSSVNTINKSNKPDQLKRYINLIKKRASEVDTDLAFLIVLCVLLPFIAVLVKEGRASSRFWISLLLTALFWLPGVIYSLLVILQKDK